MTQLEKCTQDLGNSTKAVSSAIAQLLSEATQGNENYTGELETKTVFFFLSLSLSLSQYRLCCLTLFSPFRAGMAARDVAQALKSLASAARGVAATTEDTPARNAMLDCAGDVMDKSANLIEETKRAMAKPGDPESQQRLAQVRLSLEINIS